MNKASNKSQDPRMRDAGKSFRKWKKKSNRKDDKSMMQAEVKYYKDKDMTVQDQDGSSVTRNRLTIYQGIYGHGCASGAVCREIGFTKEGKARAEADLCRIIDLARNGSVINQSRRMSTTEVTPQRSFAVKDRVTQEEVGSKAGNMVNLCCTENYMYNHQIHLA
ncbi:uncharacterized protein LOC119598539 [Penaeus monodon]|uniref:uncharacterized protein LOC119598539 n=1 Tax=Penaeus monodon TaxID=6687 RepID=UPI0018A71601|nr:uncharacterized protein LOC119598539 [Penaeus monodon]